MGDQPLDAIHIIDLAARCIVGIYPEERAKKQDVVINISLFADLRQAGKTDRIEDTVDYKAVKQRVLALVEESSYFLIERLAEDIAATCFEEGHIDAVTVRVEKPGALRFARSVAVEVHRRRPDSSSAQSRLRE